MLVRVLQRVTDLPFDAGSERGSSSTSQGPDSDVMGVAFDFLHRFCVVCRLEEPRHVIQRGLVTVVLPFFLFCFCPPPSFLF